MRRADSVFTATTGAARRKRWSRSRRTIPIPNAVARIPALIQTKGAEIGVRTLACPASAKHRFACGICYSDSELQQDGDTGGTVASKQPSDRYGVEWANYYTP
jgi:hypothetical protein